MDLANRRDMSLADRGPTLGGQVVDFPKGFCLFVKAAWYFPYAGTPARSVKESSHLRFMVFCQLTQRRN